MSKLKPAFFALLICVSCFLISVISSYASEESLTITTYYPSPYGSYRELRSQRMAIGDNYIAGSQYCWEGTCTNTINANADLVVEGNVGIGTVSPEWPLDVRGAITLRTKNVNDSFDIQFHDADDLFGSYKWDLTYRGNTQNDDLLLFRNGGGMSVMTWQNSTGNVGIGTGTPNSSKGTGGYLDVKDVYLRDTGKWASDDSQGLWCGLDPAGGGSYMLCKGYAPESSCPPGYNRISISIAGGTLQTSFANQTPYQTYETTHYTCIKN